MLAETDKEIEKCFEVMHELRHHLTQDAFVKTVRMMQTEGFQLAFLEVDNQVVAVSGYRIYTNLHLGKHCYVDDLVTASEHRSKGYGDQLLAWIRDQAKQAGCSVLHLDSATHRTRAHKFYFERGFTISSFHFTEELD